MAVIDPATTITQSGDYTVNATLTPPRGGISVTRMRIYQDATELEDAAASPASATVTVEPFAGDGTFDVVVVAEDSIGREYTLTKTYTYSINEYLIVAHQDEPNLGIYEVSAIDQTAVASADTGHTENGFRDIAANKNGLVGLLGSAGEVDWWLFDKEQETLTLQQTMASLGTITAISMHPSGDYFAAGGGTYIYVFQRYETGGVQQWQQIQQIQGNAGQSLRYSNDGNYLAYSSGAVAGVTVLPVDANGLLGSSVASSTTYQHGHMAWSPDDSILATEVGDSGFGVKFGEFDGNSFNWISFTATYQASQNPCNIAWSPNGLYLASTGAGGGTLLCLFKVVGTTITDLTSAIDTQPPGAGVNGVAWSADSTQLYVADGASNVLVYDLANDALTYREALDAGGSADCVATFEYEAAPAALSPREYIGFFAENLQANLYLEEKGWKVRRNPLSGSGSIYCKHSTTKTSGKFDVRFTVTRTSGQYGPFVGIGKTWPPTSTLGSGADEWACWTYDSGVGQSVTRNNGVNTSRGATGDLDPAQELMMAVDFDAGKIWFGIDGTWFASGDPETGTNPTYSSLGTGPFYLILDLFQTGGENSVVLVHPDDFVTPASSGFTAGWPENV